MTTVAGSLRVAKATCDGKLEGFVPSRDESRALALKPSLSAGLATVTVIRERLAGIQSLRRAEAEAQ